jgi:hypothetical protein
MDAFMSKLLGLVKMDTEKLKVDWRDNLIKQVIEENRWYPHPIILDYEGNTQGELRNTKTNCSIIGSVSGGRRVISHGVVGQKRKKYQYHRVLMECLYNTIIPPGFDIDHKDANPLNNKFNNLQILTRKEHAQKTADQNPERGKKAGVKSSYRIICFKKNEHDERTDERLFDSVNEAIRITSISQNRIMRSINRSIPDSKGYYWIRVESDNDIIGEAWRQVPECRNDMLVSNKGRVWFKFRPNPYKTFGSKTLEGYFTFSCDKRAIKVHQSVILAFTGPPPSDDHTVDHIDQNKENNCIENLRWASKIEQAKNRECMRRIEVYDTENPGVTLKTFDTEREAAEEYNTTQSCISEVVRFQINGYVRTRSNGVPRASQHIKRGTKLSARYADLTNEEKMNRELSFFEYIVKVFKQDKNKRKSNPENLPIGVTRTLEGGLVMTIKFLGEKYQKCGGKDPQYLSNLREEWFNEKVKSRIEFIRSSFANVTSV